MTLVGPPRERLALRLLGPGHQPFIRNDFVLDPDVDPLRVVVPTGARLIGRVGPSEVLSSFALDGQPGDGSPGIRLVRVGDERATFPIGQFSAPLGEDGGLELAHVPPGTWNLHLAYSELQGQRVTPKSVYVRTVAGLGEGETREVEVDISKLQRGMLRAQIFLNGLVPDEATVSASGNRLNDRGEEEDLYTQNLTTSGTGHVSLLLIPGTYRLSVNVFSETSNRWNYLPRSERFVMDPGGQLDRVFQIQTSRLRVHVLGSDGETPVPGLRLFARTLEGEGAGNAQTDADGWALFEHVPIETVRLSAYPRHMASSDVQMKYRQRTGKNAEPLDLILVEIEGRDDETVTELVMPRESGY